jgi:hypothetical protein
VRLGRPRLWCRARKRVAYRSKKVLERSRFRYLRRTQEGEDRQIDDNCSVGWFHNAEGYCLHLLKNASPPSNRHNFSARFKTGVATGLWPIHTVPAFHTRKTARRAVAKAVSAIFERARVNAFYHFVNLGLALAWRELLPAALDADRSSSPSLIKSRLTILSDPTATVSRRCDSRAEIRGDNCGSPRHT